MKMKYIDNRLGFVRNININKFNNIYLKKKVSNISIKILKGIYYYYCKIFDL